MKSNTLTIIKKEFARFFGDRQLVFTAVIMPGLLIYLIYSLMGTGINSMINASENQQVTLQIENMPSNMDALLLSYSSPMCNVELKAFSEADIKKLEDKELNKILMRFPADFEQQVADYDPYSGEPAPNIEIYRNSSNMAVDFFYKKLCEGLMNRGIKIVSGGTDNHLMLIDLTNFGLTGKEVEVWLDEANITANKNTIPNDPQSPFVTSGIRIGTAAVTTRGLVEEDMEKIAEYISMVINDFEGNAETVRQGVNEICKKYPLYE